VFEGHTIFPIGIDIGSRNLFAVQLQQSRQSLVVRGLLQRALPANTEDPVEAGEMMLPWLKEVNGSNRFRGKKAAVHLPSHDILSFPIRFKCDRPQDLEAAILRESSKYLPFPVEEAIMDYPSITEDKSDHYRATVIAVHRDQINAYLNIFKRAGLMVETVDFQVSSLMRLHGHFFNITHRPDILCHIGQAQTLLAVVTADSIVAQRYVPWGMQVLIEKIAANLVLSDGPCNVKILIKNYGLSFDADQSESTPAGLEGTDEEEQDSMRRVIHQILAPHMEVLIHEFHKLIGYVRSEEQNSTFEKIFIYGQGAFICGLDQYLASRLDIPTLLINPLTKVTMANVGIIDQSKGGPFALAMGLALRKVVWL
jgi:type IV pilus assembly protein PilM